MLAELLTLGFVKGTPLGSSTVSESKVPRVGFPPTYTPVNEFAYVNVVLPWVTLVFCTKLSHIPKSPMHVDPTNPACSGRPQHANHRNEPRFLTLMRPHTKWTHKTGHPAQEF